MFRPITMMNFERVMPHEIILCVQDGTQWKYHIALNVNTHDTSRIFIDDQHIWEYLLESRPRWFMLYLDIPLQTDPDPIIQSVCEWVAHVYQQSNDAGQEIDPADTLIDQMETGSIRKIRIKFMIELENAEQEHMLINQLLSTLTYGLDDQDPDPDVDVGWSRFLRLDLNMQYHRRDMWPLQTVHEYDATTWEPVNYEVRIYNPYTYLIGIYSKVEDCDNPLADLATLTLSSRRSAAAATATAAELG